MNTEQEIENAKLKIMQEMNSKFDKVLDDLNMRGTEFSRRLSQEIENDRERVTKELENLWSFSKSKLISIETGQKMFYNEILPKLMDKIDITVQMARDSASHTAQVLKTGRIIEKDAGRAEGAANRAETALRSGNWQTIGIIVAIVGMILTGGGKLFQDWFNQKQMMSVLEALNKGVKIVETLEERAKQLGSGQLPEDKKERKGVKK